MQRLANVRLAVEAQPFDAIANSVTGGYGVHKAHQTGPVRGNRPIVFNSGCGGGGGALSEPTITQSPTLARCPSAGVHALTYFHVAMLGYPHTRTI